MCSVTISSTVTRSMFWERLSTDTTPCSSTLGSIIRSLTEVSSALMHLSRLGCSFDAWMLQIPPPGAREFLRARRSSRRGMLAGQGWSVNRVPGAVSRENQAGWDWRKMRTSLGWRVAGFGWWGPLAYWTSLAEFSKTSSWLTEASYYNLRIIHSWGWYKCGRLKLWEWHLFLCMR